MNGKRLWLVFHFKATYFYIFHHGQFIYRANDEIKTLSQTLMFQISCTWLLLFEGVPKFLLPWYANLIKIRNQDFCRLFSNSFNHEWFVYELLIQIWCYWIIKSRKIDKLVMFEKLCHTFVFRLKNYMKNDFHGSSIQVRLKIITCPYLGHL